MDTFDRILLVLMIVGVALLVLFSWSGQEALLKEVLKNTAPTIANEVELPSSELANLTASIAALEKRIAPMEKVLVGLLKERQTAMAAVKEQPEIEGPVEAPNEDVSEVPRNKVE